MPHPSCGIWLVGAWGGVGTTTAVGLAALQRGLTDETGLVSALPRYRELELLPWDRFVVGGHEIRQTTYAAEANRLHEQSRVFEPRVLDQVADALSEWDAAIRPGTLHGVGATIESLAAAPVRERAQESPAEAIERTAADMRAFRDEHSLAHVVVVNIGSTEPPLAALDASASWDELRARLGDRSQSPLPASSLYAIAAFEAGYSFVNFTPSLGSNLPALCEFAVRKGALHAGQDGKTGETLLKSVLAPMFAERNLDVMSWVGHNIFGNLDGKVLDDPVNKATKVRSKDTLLGDILGYKPQSLVSIEYIESLGDWKTAWDHIHFRGFLGTPMTLQFTWQGCDSLLAAPLVLDLVRLTEREHRRGKSGLMTHLAAFFKSPMGAASRRFDEQCADLARWANDVARA
ncbi:MAG: inositol-3-phosphate synthase [Planctomycetaceae bacterium]